MIRNFIHCPSKEWLIVLAIGIAAFLFSIGPSPLNPTNINWLLSGDPANHYVGWSFFRFSDWTFPLSYFNTMLNPYGTTVIQTDSIPILAILFKSINFVLPSDFQYFGFWYFLCFILQAHFAFRLARSLSLSKVNQFLLCGFITFSPVLFFRQGHTALNAHFLILWLIAIYIEKKDKTICPATFAQLLLVNLIATGVHPYLLTMTLTLSTAIVWRQWHVHGYKTGLFLLFSYLSASTLFAALLG